MADYRPFTENALKILRARYLMRNEEGDFLDKEPADLFRRVARHIASAEKTKKDRERWAEKFFDAMMARDFLPNSPTLTGAGRDMCLSACFVLPIEDSLDSIFETVKNAALVHKEGGGTGFDFSRLRPKGSFVKRTQGIASGPVSFLRVIDSATEAVKQGGTRRGANMGILRVDHPDVEEFIRMKIDGKSVNNFNISVAVTDVFMEAVKADGSYDITDPYHKKVVAKRKARPVFDQIVESAWAVGDPGLIFIDRINAHNPTRGLGPIRSTNPCGEQPLHEYESCNLGSINLGNYFSRSSRDLFDWERFGRTIVLAVRFLDDVIDVNKYPLPQIEQMTRANRRIGLGVMGWADLLLRMQVRYDSPAAIKMAERIMAIMRKGSSAASTQLAEERGSFPNIAKSVYKGKKMRNATTLTIAPTGTISRIAGCSSSIEPVNSPPRSSTARSKTSTPSMKSGRRLTPRAPFLTISAPLMRSLPNGTSGRRPPSRSMSTTPSPRRSTFPTRRKSRTWRRPICRLMSSTPRASPSTGTAAGPSRCSTRSHPKLSSTPRTVPPPFPR